MALYAFFFHQPCHSRAAGGLSPSQQLLVNTRAAIGFARIQPDLLNSPPQALVFFGTIGGLAAHPAIISTSAYIEYLGHSRYGKYVLVFSHKLEDYPFLVVKMP